MSAGYIKLFRSMKQSAFYRDSEYVHLWVHLLMSVNRTKKRLKIDKSNQFIDLLPGQVLTSRKALASQTGIHSSKIERILKAFEIEHQIEQQTFSKYRVISVTKWEQYQCCEHENEQQMNSKRTASEQQVNTNKNEKKEENEKKETTTAPRTKTESVFLEVFNEKESTIKRLFPQHDYEVVKEGCLAHYRGHPPPVDPYPVIHGWFQRQQLNPPKLGKPPKPEVNVDDRKKAFLGTD